jgi:hypothetical protein
MAVKLLNKAEYARHRGCDEKAVRKAIHEGRISAVNGKIDPAVADIQWAQNTRPRIDAAGPAEPTQTPPPAGPESAAAKGSANDAPAGETGGAGNDRTSYQDLRTQRERVELERAQRENAKAAGRLVDRDQVDSAVFDAFRQLRDAVFDVAQRVAPKLVSLADTREIELELAGELRKSFNGWEARMLSRLPKREEG